MTKQEILNEIEKYSVISFDIFETLVFRSCKNPTMIFYYVGKKLGLDGNTFRKARIDAERIARKKAGLREISLDEIYNSFSDEYKFEKDKAIRVEENIELEQAIPNEPMISIINRIKDKDIYLTSDMYLPREIIEKIVKKCGVTARYTLLLSSEKGSRKADGNLYKLLISVSGKKARDIVHIGDNYKSDYIIPKLKGVHSILYSSSYITGIVENQEYRNLEDFIKSHNNKSRYEKFGYEILGPAVLGYVLWINQQLKERNINKVFFFAREGQFIKRAFDCLNENYQERYLYVSRRSLTVPALVTAQNIDDFLAYRPIYDRVTVDSEIEKLGLALQDFANEKWYGKYHASRFGDIDRKIKREIIEALYTRSKIEAKAELELLLQYLSENEVFGKFAVIDLGWNGSMQRALQDIFNFLGYSNEMTGFFLAQRDEYYKNAEHIKNYGYLFNYDQVSNYENILLNSGTNLLEFLFSADHGSTIKYQKLNGHVEPVLDDYEFSDSYKIIKICQEAAISFIKDYLNECGIGTSQTDYKFMFSPFYHILRRPSGEDIKLFGDVKTSDMNETDLYLAKKSNPMLIRRFIEDFKDSNWKVAFLNRNLHTKNGLSIYTKLRAKFN